MKFVKACILLFLFSTFYFSSKGQDYSVARDFNEIMIEAQQSMHNWPSVQSRNMYHASLAMYEAWAAFDECEEQMFLGKTLGEYTNEFDGFVLNEEYSLEEARHIAISYAAFRLIRQKSINTNSFALINYYLEAKMYEYGYDIEYESIDYSDGNPQALGNYIAEEIIAYGYIDFSNEINNYENQSYASINESYSQDLDSIIITNDPNRFQPLEFLWFIPTHGEPIFDFVEFLSPEWGQVTPFSLSESDMTLYERDGWEYPVYHDPGNPNLIDTATASDFEDPYKWNFCTNLSWGSHFDTSDGILWDISPNSKGNIAFETLPTTFNEIQDFYHFTQGGVESNGRNWNPITESSYETQYIPRADYIRTIWQFWSDGWDDGSLGLSNRMSVPTIWMRLLYEINDNSSTIKKWRGKGEVLDDLEWDIKTNLCLTGGLHDAAISCWGAKGWYDHIASFTALTWMVQNGQSTNVELPNYDKNGIPLIPGLIELVSEIDPLVGETNEHLNKIKIKTWRGLNFILNANIDEAEVDWILFEDWFAGFPFTASPYKANYGPYISEASSFSYTAAEILTNITGSEFFPGGLHEVFCEQNQFLSFEEGPSVDVTLQWATYQDAANECALSQIWGGVSTPDSDIKGRKMGHQVGIDAFAFANALFDIKGPEVVSIIPDTNFVGTEIIDTEFSLHIFFDEIVDTTSIFDIVYYIEDPTLNSLTFINSQWIDCDEYQITYSVENGNEFLEYIQIIIPPLTDDIGNIGQPDTISDVFVVDFIDPILTSLSTNVPLINNALVGDNTFQIIALFEEEMDTLISPLITFTNDDPTLNTIVWNDTSSLWIDSITYLSSYNVIDNEIYLNQIDVELSGAKNVSNQTMEIFTEAELFVVDTEDPYITSITNQNIVSESDGGTGGFSMLVEFHEPMSTTGTPSLDFPDENPLTNALTANNELSGWLDDYSYEFIFDVMDANEDIPEIDIIITNGVDANDNIQQDYLEEDYFSVDTRNPIGILFSANTYLVTPEDIGTSGLIFTIVYDEEMSLDTPPLLVFPDIVPDLLEFNLSNSHWLNSTTYQFHFDVLDYDELLMYVSLEVLNAVDLNGNPQVAYYEEAYFGINTWPISVSENENNKEGISLFPNPIVSGEDLFLRFENIPESLEIRISDMSGKLIFQEKMESNISAEIKINTYNLSTGAYLLYIYRGFIPATFLFEIEK